MSNWIQNRPHIDGEIGDLAGYSVSLSNDGQTVAIGAPGDNKIRVYKWNESGSAWQKIGDDIDGEGSSGWSVSLSADGSVVAIEFSYNDNNGDDSGHVRIYEWNVSAWEQRGSDIDGEDEYDESGYSVSLSADGNIVAIGAICAIDENDNDTGHVRVYQWNATSKAWAQMGSDIDGEGEEDESGYSVSLSADGSVVAIGAIL